MLVPASCKAGAPTIFVNSFLLCYNTPMSAKIRGIVKRTCVIILGAAMLLFNACAKTERSTLISEISKRYSAPKDKQLIVYTSHKEEVYLPIIREFENRTGIWVEIHAGGTTEMFKEVREAAKEGACDIMFGGGIESYEAGKDLFMPYEVSDKEKLDQNCLSEGDSWTPFTELPLVFVYNNKLVSKEEAPSCWAELTTPKWKGQIAFADLHSSGTSYTILSTISQMSDKPVDEAVKSFIDNLDGRVVNSSGQVISQVAAGSYLFGITLEETAQKSIKAGDDISMVYPKEGTATVPDGVAMVKNAPHSYNAGLFIDFVTGYDTQVYAMDEFFRRPVRTDIVLPEGYTAIDSIDFDIEKSAAEEETIFEIWDSYIKEED